MNFLIHLVTMCLYIAHTTVKLILSLCIRTVLEFYYLLVFKSKMYLTATGSNMASSAMSMCRTTISHAITLRFIALLYYIVHPLLANLFFITPPPDGVLVLPSIIRWFYFIITPPDDIIMSPLNQNMLFCYPSTRLCYYITPP